jgi:hypothetical protein
MFKMFTKDGTMVSEVWELSDYDEIYQSFELFSVSIFSLKEGTQTLGWVTEAAILEAKAMLIWEIGYRHA